MRKESRFRITDVSHFKKSLLQWAQQFEEVVWLDSNNHQSSYSSFDGLMAVDALTVKITDAQNGFADLKEYQKETDDWIFGYLSYDLKNDVERLSSNNFDGLGFPELCFFQPKKIIRIEGKELYFNYLNMVADDIEADFKLLTKASAKPIIHKREPRQIRIRMRIFKDEYFKQVHRMLEHIQRGDIYEANFCQEFYAEDIAIDPMETYHELNTISKAPFATFFKLGDKFLLSASPERYLRKENTKVISQPIKGTSKRSVAPREDKELKDALKNDEKERAENIMIVDLVRNDFSKYATKGTVQVEELCEVYSFQQVHQLISTVSAEVATAMNPIDCVQQTFPMGSMTGAPKVSAMKIIEELESFKRGLYSGAVGYFSPKGDCDFNVVIRSILYNATKRYVSFSVGSAITAKSIPEKEYEECLLKAKAMREVLEDSM